MQDQASDDSAQERALKDEGTVLLHVLDRGLPGGTPMYSLMREITGGTDKYTVEWDRLEQAAWRLVSVGLLLKGYERIEPSTQARHFNEILEANGVL